MRKLTKGLLVAGIVSLPAMLGMSSAQATDSAAPYTVSTNVAVVSDYYFRGLTQTWHEPALQGGLDVNFDSGWYAGTWLSNVSGNQYAGGSLEWDYYGGYNGKINNDWSWTAGLYGYYYPGANNDKSTPPGASKNYNTLEWNAGISYKWVSLKYSRTTTDSFGVENTQGSSYLDLSADIPLPNDFSLGLHAGRTDVANSASADYNDYKVSVDRSFHGGWDASLAYVKATNSQTYDNTASLANSDTTDLGKGKLIVSVSRSF